MANIALYAGLASAPVPAGLPYAVKNAALALQDSNPPAGQLKEKRLQAALVGYLSAALFILNHTSSYADDPNDPNQEAGTQIAMLAAEVARMIQRRFPSFRPKEIEEAIRCGASGDYFTPGKGQILALSVAGVQGWLNSYQQQARQPALVALQSWDGKPEFENLPAWHPVQFYLNAWPICAGIFRLAEAGGKYERFELETLHYDWLQAIGAFRVFRSLAELHEMKNEEARKVARQPAGDKDDSLKGMIRYFREEIEKDRFPENHKLSLETIANCRRRLFREWVLAQQPEYVFKHLQNLWATAYFQHYQLCQS